MPLSVAEKDHLVRLVAWASIAFALLAFVAAGESRSAGGFTGIFLLGYVIVALVLAFCSAILVEAANSRPSLDRRNRHGGLPTVHRLVRFVRDAILLLRVCRSHHRKRRSNPRLRRPLGNGRSSAPRPAQSLEPRFLHRFRCPNGRHGSRRSRRASARTPRAPRNRPPPSPRENLQSNSIRARPFGIDPARPSRFSGSLECEQGCLAFLDNELERIFVWRIKPGESPASGPETLPLSRMDAYLLDSLEVTMCWNSLEGAGEGFGWDRRTGQPVANPPKPSTAMKDELGVKSLVAATMQEADGRPSGRVMIVNRRREILALRSQPGSNT